MSTVSRASLAERLAEILGPGHVAAMRGHDVEGLRPSGAVAPETLDEAELVLAAAREAGAAVTPWGGGTQERIGPPRA